MELNRSVYSVGGDMRLLAKKHGIPQQELANEMGISLGTLRRRDIWTKHEVKTLFDMIYRKTGTSYDLEQTIRNIELKTKEYEIEAKKIQGRPYLETERVIYKGRLSIAPFINGLGITLKEVENDKDGIPYLTKHLARVSGLGLPDLVRLSSYIKVHTGISIHPLDFASRYLPLDKVTY